MTGMSPPPTSLHRYALAVSRTPTLGLPRRRRSGALLRPRLTNPLAPRRLHRLWIPHHRSQGHMCILMDHRAEGAERDQAMKKAMPRHLRDPKEATRQDVSLTRRARHLLALQAQGGYLSKVVVGQNGTLSAVESALSAVDGKSPRLPWLLHQPLRTHDGRSPKRSSLRPGLE